MKKRLWFGLLLSNGCIYYCRHWYHVYIIAGESSGDKLGHYLVESLKKVDNQLLVHGVGGPLLRKQGLNSLFPYEQLSVMGWSSALLCRLPLLWYRLKQVERDILFKQPDAIIAIDSKGFSSRIFQAISHYTRKDDKHWKPLRIQYVAPSVWAIQDGLRAAQQFGKWVDHILLLFPFESVVWKQAHVPFTLVGPSFCESFPLLDNCKDARDGTRLVALLGSRMQEVKRAAPLVLKCFELLKTQGMNNLQLVIPYVGHTFAWIENFTRWHADVELVNGEDERAYFEALGRSDLAVAVSGTAVMECHICQLAVIVIYPCDWLTSWMVKKKVIVRYASVANIMLDQYIVPELLLEQCKVENLLPLLRNGLMQPEWRTRQLLALKPWINYFRDWVQCQGKPSEKAANTILALLKEKKTQ